MLFSVPISLRMLLLPLQLGPMWETRTFPPMVCPMDVRSPCISGVFPEISRCEFLEGAKSGRSQTWGLHTPSST